jgi:alanyl-tRNA synthetase
MKTQILYYDQSHLNELDVSILAKTQYEGRPALVLDKTILYPEGGGQGADHGWINGVPVLDVQFVHDEILHFVSDASALEPGPARLALDRDRRRDLSTQHTAQHLLSATILRLTGAPTVSMHLGDRFNTIDVDTPSLAPEELAVIEDSVQEIIREDYRIITHLCPPEDVNSFPLRKKPPEGESQLRIVEIDGYDYSPCAGIHLPSTGPIGALAVIGAEKYKGMMRVSFIAGQRVIREYRALRESAGQASRTLKVPQDELAGAVAALTEKLGLQEKQFIILKERLAQFEAAQILQEQGHSSLLSKTFSDKSMDDVLRVGRALQKETSQFILVASIPDLKVALLSSRTDVDLRPVCKALLEAHGGSGGGGPTYYQGAFTSRDAMNKFIQGAERHEYFNQNR